MEIRGWKGLTERPRSIFVYMKDLTFQSWHMSKIWLPGIFKFVSRHV